MKAILKRVLKAAWRATLPLRRPLTTRFERYLTRCLNQTVSHETNLVLDCLVTQTFRLQAQVEVLQEMVRERFEPQARAVGVPAPHFAAAASGPSRAEQTTT